MSAESLALIPQCAESNAVWLPAGEERWRAYHAGDDPEGPGRGDRLFYCPACAEREFGADREG